MNRNLFALIAMTSVPTAAEVTLAIPSVPDNGSGTADMPLHHDYTAAGPMCTADGLPSGPEKTRKRGSGEGAV